MYVLTVFPYMTPFGNSSLKQNMDLGQHNSRVDQENMYRQAKENKTFGFTYSDRVSCLKKIVTWTHPNQTCTTFKQKSNTLFMTRDKGYHAV
jgi:hypothetical protein